LFRSRKIVDKYRQNNKRKSWIQKIIINSQLSIVNCQLISLKYGNVVALQDISFEVERGELFGLIGPDGAGKTSLFRVLTTLILADSGTATVDGLDVVSDYKEIRNRVGYMPGRFSLYQDLTVEENLNFFATVFLVGQNLLFLPLVTRWRKQVTINNYELQSPPLAGD